MATKAKKNYVAGYVLGKLTCIFYKKLFHGKVGIEIDGQRIHHWQIGMTLTQDKEDFWIGFGQALLEDDIKDFGEWVQ